MSAMLRAVAASRLPVCSQQQGEPDLDGAGGRVWPHPGQLYHEKRELLSAHGLWSTRPMDTARGDHRRTSTVPKWPVRHHPPPHAAHLRATAPLRRFSA